MHIKSYNYLPEEAVFIRKTVFMEEQGFINEFDKSDEISIHIVLFVLNNPIATCRLYYSDSQNCYVIGRIATIKEYRGNKYGAEIVKYAENVIRKRKGVFVGLSAQENAKGFYRKLGYQTYGEPYMDEGCSHIWMKKEL